MLRVLDLMKPSKAQINQQLLGLEQTLQSPPVDRSNYLAAITDAQSKLQDLSSHTWERLCCDVSLAAKTVQSAAVSISRIYSWDSTLTVAGDPAKVSRPD